MIALITSEHVARSILMSTRAAAIASVNRHVEPKACFITQDSGSATSWRPLGGTGCAHWVAHQLGIKGGVAGSNACMERYLLRVSQLVAGMTAVRFADLAVNDVWTNDGLTHTGLVIAIHATNGVPSDLTIRHCSSDQGGVFDNLWSQHFHSQGRFYRYGGSTQAQMSGQGAASTSGTRSERAAFG